MERYGWTKNYYMDMIIGLNIIVKKGIGNSSSLSDSKTIMVEKRNGGNAQKNSCRYY